MHFKFWFFVCVCVGVGLGAAAPGFGRSVSLETFDQISNQKSVLSAPGGQKPVPAIATASPRPGPSEALASDFEHIGTDRGRLHADPAPVTAFSPSPHVPYWMGRKSAQRARTLVGYFHSPAAQSVPGSLVSSFDAPAGSSPCLRPVYRPKGLNAEVELRRSHYYSLMVEIACEVGVPVNLFDALLTQESGYNPYALSPKGAMGIAQLMPGTAKMAGVLNAWDIEENMRGGARILKMNLAEFGRYDLALAAYNAGAGRVRIAGGVPHIRETTSYVSSILSDVRRQFATDVAHSNSVPVHQVRTRLISFP